MCGKLFKRSGFTLVELMVVCGIILVLVSIAMPNFTNYRRSSFQAACVAQLKNMQTAKNRFYVSHSESSTCTSTDFVSTDGVHPFRTDPKCPKTGNLLSWGTSGTDDVSCSEASDTDYPHRLTGLYKY